MVSNSRYRLVLMFLLVGGSTILPGSTIGDNVIIGAGACVSGWIEYNSVYAGNPAKRICSIEEWIEKREQKQLDEAVVIYKKYCELYGKNLTRRFFMNIFICFLQLIS